MNTEKQQLRIYYVYYLRRPDKRDQSDEELDGPFYVGYGKNNRVYDHRKEAKYTKIKEVKTIKIKIIHKLWKCSLDFTEEIMFDNLTEQEAKEIEMSAIAFYGRINNGTGCLANLTDGGEGGSGMVISEEAKQKNREWHLGREYSEEAIKNMSASQRKRYDNPNYVNPLKGRALSESHKESIKNGTKGRVLSEEHKQHIKDSHPHLRGEDHPCYGRKATEEEIRKRIESRGDMTGENATFYNKKHTEEAKKKIGDANRGRVHTEEDRKKISEGKKGKPSNFKGKQHKEESKERMRGPRPSMAGENHPLWGKSPSEESKQKNRESNTGKTLSEETKQKMRGPRGPQKNPRRKKTDVEEE